MADTQTVTLQQKPRDAIRLPQSDGSFSDFTFDAVISEQHSQRLQVTENPIETGVNVADHCFVDAQELQLVASVSDVKMPNAASGYDSAAGRSNYAYQKLANLQNQLAQNQLQPFVIRTSVKTYKNMVMTEIQMMRDKTTPRLGRFQMSFKQVIIVDTQRASYAMPGPTKRSAQPKKDAGAQQPKSATDQQQKAVNRDSALLKKLEWSLSPSGGK